MRYNNKKNNKACNELAGPISASFGLSNTDPFKEMSQWWRAVGNTMSALTSPRFDLNLEPPTPETSALLLNQLVDSYCQLPSVNQKLLQYVNENIISLQIRQLNLYSQFTVKCTGVKSSNLKKSNVKLSDFLAYKISIVTRLLPIIFHKLSQKHRAKIGSTLRSEVAYYNVL